MFALNLRSRLFLALEVLLGRVVMTSTDHLRGTTTITFAAVPHFKGERR